MEKPERRATAALLLRVRSVVAANNREGALALLLELLTGGAGNAEALSEVAANALVATARAEGERNDMDRAALTTYRRAALVSADEEVVVQVSG